MAPLKNKMNVTDFLNAFGKKSKPRFVSAIILAGGNSTRMGNGISKQWLTLDGLPVVVRTLMAFEQATTVNEIILVANASELDRYEDLSTRYGLKKLVRVVKGGDTRQESAKNGFLSCCDHADFVAIHDGARCLITPTEIDKVCRAAFLSGAATAATQVHDTVKVANSSGYIEKTVDRNHVWLAQTPQVFGVSVYHAALAVAKLDNIAVTDDCSLAEHIGHAVRLVPCSSDNIKLTTPRDISLAEHILAMRKKGEK